MEVSVKYKNTHKKIIAVTTENFKYLIAHNATKLKINSKSLRIADWWRLNKTSLNDKCIKEEIKMKILKFPEINKNEKKIYQNL